MKDLAPKAATPRPHSGKIVAVDDERMNLELLRFLLEKNGYDYFGTDRPEGLFDFLEASQPDLILLDIMMPTGSEGFEVCRNLKEQEAWSSIPVIFLTGVTEASNKVRGFEAGGVDYVTKPFHEEELLARIRTHIDLKKAREQLTEQAKRLEVSNKLKDRMFAIIGHDLRSPLSAVKLKLDFIDRGIIDPAADNFKHETLFDLQQALDESINLLHNLLGWAKSTSGELQVFPEVLDLRELGEQTFRLLRVGLEHKKIEYRNNVPDGLFAYADMNTTKTVLRNLVSNAMKFTPTGGKVEIVGYNKKGRAFLEIRDSGRGMTAEELRKIADPDVFYTQPGTEKEAGTGLGLRLCRDYVAKSGGILEIESRLGSGSVFRIDLPAHTP